MLDKIYWVHDFDDPRLIRHEIDDYIDLMPDKYSHLFYVAEIPRELTSEKEEIYYYGCLLTPISRVTMADTRIPRLIGRMIAESYDHKKCHEFATNNR